MEVKARVNTKYGVSMQMNDMEIANLIAEMEMLFIRSSKDGTVEDYRQIMEFKNLLTLSVNNTR